MNNYNKHEDYSQDHIANLPLLTGAIYPMYEDDHLVCVFITHLSQKQIAYKFLPLNPNTVDHIGSRHIIGSRINTASQLISSLAGNRILPDELYKSLTANEAIYVRSCADALINGNLFETFNSETSFYHYSITFRYLDNIPVSFNLLRGNLEIFYQDKLIQHDNGNVTILDLTLDKIDTLSEYPEIEIVNEEIYS